ncbi:MAG: hypothetical protein QM809_11805 [Gordonia sp. (in: high G+C Gram-positive bacteria)]|uniref:hypothetical protein n=1 Tax=Gordonia sp. (in: high G+C Gram-positive bacteria) TaxID=84139 RepID=UPI0039E2C0E1
MKFRKFLMAGAIAGLVGVTAACGSDDDSLPPVPAASTTAAADESASAAPEDKLESELSDANKRPSVEALNEMLQMALDPKISPEDKTVLVEGSEADPKLFNQLVEVAQDNPDVDYEIKKPVISNGPKRASVKFEVRIPDNPPTKIDASIVYDDGRWKLSKQTVCPLLSAQNVKTPACADTAAGASSSAGASAN